jgi:hypothetical protein
MFEDKHNMLLRNVDTHLPDYTCHNSQDQNINVRRENLEFSYCFSRLCGLDLRSCSPLLRAHELWRYKWRIWMIAICMISSLSRGNMWISAIRRAWDPHSSGYEEFCLLGLILCLPPASFWFLAYLIYQSSRWRQCFSETSVVFHWTTRCHFP